ncbi:MAG: acyl-CoA/acyl-ACP dehydrogenase [Pirellulaceae bacterium]|jgi:alkylation response protein AidB-like acyl-CoA dehydrogenase|nr:acyl-CoA/acyl-ACP dehydrogenase [Pirellulaceae bacterium]
MMTSHSRIRHPDDPALTELCDELSELTPSLEADDAWPAHQLQQCGRSGVFEWFVDTQWGGQAWNEADVIRGYLRLSAACLTTTFIITQRTAACRRLASTDNAWVRDTCVPALLRGDHFATVGISHLTTSRRHLARPALAATLRDDAVILDGFSPWVTGAAYANWIVIGATLQDDRQVLLAVPRDLPGVVVLPPWRLLGVSASQTGPVTFEQAVVPRKWLLAGPTDNVMQAGAGGTSGGLQTSTLATGLADTAITYLELEGRQRPELERVCQSLRSQWTRLRDDLLEAAGGTGACSAEQLRTRANSLVLRATQSALAAAKGTGYVVSHPVGRWCREALFFLVWSCPQGVLQAGLCELAGLSG